MDSTRSKNFLSTFAVTKEKAPHTSEHFPMVSDTFTSLSAKNR